METALPWTQLPQTQTRHSNSKTIDVIVSAASHEKMLVAVMSSTICIRERDMSVLWDYEEADRAHLTRRSQRPLAW